MKGIESFKQLEPSNLVNDLKDYIEHELPAFAHSKEFASILIKKKNENQHSSAFCNFMTFRSSSRYYFERETSQKGSSTIDIGIYLGSNLIYTIEAKVLPTPKGTKTNPRNEHEYVYGKGAGIQRFKDESHGLDNENNLLSESGLIAYVKEKDFKHWYEKVNQWIVDASWDGSEKLEIVYFKAIAILKSKHVRKNQSKVALNHFWVYVSDEKLKE